ncbi:GNAT family N-acetyltransferase [Fusobacterium polymorphum]|uniref:GNAT family N-acetyltransferase n=1 Tax=Fusobacterium nucleatum subsp. polymorphum TaxID=76857 RepID=UPI003008AB9E
MNAEININNVILETERLILRAWEITDLDNFFEYASVNSVGEKAGWEHHKSKDESLEILKMFIDEKKVFAIILKANQKAIGSIGVEECRQDLDKNLENLFGRELGYVLSKDYWNKGIMTEAVSKVIEYCFKILKLNYLIATCFNYNIASKRVLEKLNFKYYKDISIETRYNTKEESTLMILKNIKNLNFLKNKN